MSLLPSVPCLLAAASLAIALASFAGAPGPQHPTKAPAVRTTPYAGMYAYGTAPKQPTGQLTVYPESDSTILFYLDLDTGSPTHTNGTLLQRARVHGPKATATFDGGYAPPKDCQLTITFQPHAALVHTSAGRNACGFGNGVRADGTYARRSTAVPQHFRDGDGKVVLFKGATPDKGFND